MARNRELSKTMEQAVVERPRNTRSARADDAASPVVSEAREDHTAEVKINLRASKDDRDLIDRAAAVRHLTRTEFMLGSARKAAMDALLDQAFFPLNAAQWDAFTAALDAPPKENPKLKLLLARKAPWEK